MPSVREKVTTRSFSVGLEQWNHRWRPILLLPVFALVGYAIGFRWGVHLVPSTVADEIVVVAFGVAAIALGSAILAAVD